MEEDHALPSDAEMGEMGEMGAMGQFFDFNQATGAETATEHVTVHPDDGPRGYVCPSHQNGDCLCHGFISEDFGAEAQGIMGDQLETATDYGNFENW